MKRVLLIMAVLAVAVAAAVAYQSAARERDYRALLARRPAARGRQTLVAIEDFSGAIALRPDSMLAHLRRGETYRQRGDLDKAARDFRTPPTLDPTATRPLEELGDTLYQQQRYKAAIEAYEARLRLDDRSSAIRYKRSGRTIATATWTPRSLPCGPHRRLDPQSPMPTTCAGVCLREKGQSDRGPG